MTLSLSPVFQDAQLDNNGNPGNLHKIHTYVAGTSTPAPTFRTMAGDVAHQNPIVLNSRGEPPDPIWLTDGISYDFQFTFPGDTTPPTSPIRTFRDISGIGDTEATAQAVSQWIATLLTPTFLSTTSFSVNGNQVSLYDVGRRIQAFSAFGTAEGFIITSAIVGATTVVTVALDSGVLDASLSRVDVGIISGTRSSFLIRPVTEQIFSTAGTFTWTRPPGCRVVIADVQAGGGGGGGCLAPTVGSNTSSAGAGGGAGARSRLVILAPPASVSVVVGDRGLGGAVGVTGSNGGISSFGAFIVAPGGLGGQGSTIASNIALITAIGGLGGAAPTGGVGSPGENGDFGMIFPNQAASGRGANTSYGGGGNPVFVSAGQSANGNQGRAFGSAGSGGASSQGGQGRVGGDGLRGIVKVLELY